MPIVTSGSGLKGEPQTPYSSPLRVLPLPTGSGGLFKRCSNVTVKVLDSIKTTFFCGGFLLGFFLMASLPETEKPVTPSIKVDVTNKTVEIK